MSDLFAQTSLGNMSGFSIEIINGFNPLSLRDIEEEIWDVGGSYTFPLSADTLAISSDDENDTSAGTGARTVLVKGLNSSFVEISETITLNGIST